MWSSMRRAVKVVIKLKQSDLILLIEPPSTLLKSPSKKIKYVFLHWFLIRWAPCLR